MRLGTAALTLAVGLSVAGLACADDAPAGNWFSNWFARPASKTPEPVSGKDETPRIPTGNALKKLKADLDRRQEVCLRLLEIANEAGDEELIRKTNDLDRRAWEIYVAAKNRTSTTERPAAEPDAKKARSAKGERE